MASKKAGSSTELSDEDQTAAEELDRAHFQQVLLKIIKKSQLIPQKDVPNKSGADPTTKSRL
jgi:hypothetical protein